MKWVFKHDDLQMFDLLIWSNMSNFYQLEVVGRDGETQL